MSSNGKLLSRKDQLPGIRRALVLLCCELPPTLDGRRIGQQLLDSATSTAANYRASCRARSRAEFIAKLGTVLEEADASLFWLELMVDAELITKARAEKLLKEADELTAVFVTSLKTAKH